jgi:hydrogenase/urease accessory protein HupE
MLLPLVLAVPGSAHAHLVSMPIGEFYGGILHPLTALEHLLPWIALGLLGGLQASERARWLLLVFPGSVFVGVCAGVLLGAPAWLSTANLASLVVLSLPVMLALRLPLWLLGGLAAPFGLTHGAANGGALLPGGDVTPFVLGVTAAGYLAIALVTAGAFTLVRRFEWGSIAVRAVGSWIAAVGVLMVGLQLAR